MKRLNLALLSVLAHYSSCLNINSYAALGDSYATGTGAGDALIWPPSDAKCGRFAEAYPRQIVNANPGTIFRNLACGGSSTASVLLSQVPWIEDSQLVTLTIGGNEVDFFKVVNDCIYEWAPLANCNTTISKSRAAIESEPFRQNLEKLVKATLADMEPEARLLVTGYAQFFNDKTTQCDHVSFSRRDPENTLTRTRRNELNDLLRILNSLIKTTANDNGAEYVDINVAFEGHRFCEEGVVEPDVRRNATWFLTLDQAGRTSDAMLADNVEQAIFSRGGIPDFAVFHPSILGQKAIAEAIMKQLESETL